VNPHSFLGLPRGVLVSTALPVLCAVSLTAQTWRAEIPAGLDLYVPVPEDSPMTDEQIALGRALFADARLSRDGSVSCASCHDPATAFADNRTVAIGVFGRAGRRNVPALLNRAWGRAFSWDGRFATLEDQVLHPITDPAEMDLPLADAEQRLGLPREEIALALASYVRSILSGGSPFDRYVRGDPDALDGGQIAGLALFRGKANCSACHIGPTFTDERLHNTGIAWTGQGFADEGGGNGTFKTPTLREVARTAPYMHDGSLATLADVVDYYDRGGNQHPWLDSQIRPLRLMPEEKRALIRFLETLTGHVRDG
jgi:cytochrome c peroxidase